MNERTQHAALVGILAAFVALATVYSVVVPPFEASDELWHYPMVQTIAANWRLPVQDPAAVGPWRQEGSQPPLYYVIGALTTCWIDTSDMAKVRHLNPHVDNGVVTPDGNINLAVHDLEAEAFPWRGTVLAVHLVRLLSVAMSAAGVLLTWHIAREVLPGRPVLALAATAIHAFTPMFVFISGAVNNDNLVVPLSSLALLLLVRLAKPAEREPASPPVGRYLLLGAVLGLAALTKASSLALTVLTAVVVSLRALRRRSWREFIVGGAGTLAPLVIVAGWWYLRNLRLYGDISGLNAFIEILGQRDVPADLGQLARERYSFAVSYWGNFGGLNVPMPAWAYALLNAAAIAALLGLLIALARWLWARRSALASPITASLRRRLADWGRADFSIPLCVLWGLGVLIPWASWASVTWSSQGRLIFAALPVWSLGLAAGLPAWLPRRWRWGRWLACAFALFLLALAVAAPFAWIAPAYALPQPLDEQAVAAAPIRVEADLGGTLRLLGADLSPRKTQAGGQVAVTLYWQALAPADRDLTVFVQLVGAHDRLLAQRDTFPGLGRLTTARLEPGFRWADRYVLQLPETTFAPDLAQIAVGLYDPVTGVRLPVTLPAGGAPADHVRFGEVAVEALPGPLTNPVAIDFGQQIALEGYDLSALAARPGETLTLTLHWRG
ncbi:MAG: DUF2142 domain-containing protein, partial [Anaerolineales bacterium]|nr:DUF2142 domain-containing protein [Anaerolineales bacterium]